MSRAHFDSLDYGHLGRVHYDAGRRVWSAQRREPAVVDSLSSSRLFQSGADAGVDDAEYRFRRSRDRDNAVRDLLEDHPELQPAASQISRLFAEATRSSGVLERGGDRLCVVRVVTSREDGDSPREKPRLMSFLVAPGGSFGETLQFYPLIRASDVSPSEDGNKDPRTDRIPRRPSVEWDVFGETVRQIRIASNGHDKSDSLVVQTSNSILALGLSLQESPLDKRRNVGNGDSSSVQVDCCMRVPSPPGSNVDFADVCCDPDVPEHIGAIDTDGRWWTWSVNKTKLTGAAIADDPPPPVVMEAGTCDLPTQVSHTDGFPRIVFNPGTPHLVTCTSSFVEVAGKKDSSVSRWEPRRRIRDCRASLAARGIIHVLTETQIVLLRLRQSADAVELEELMAWAHHRDPDDACLKMSSYRIGDDEESLLLFTNRTGLITEHRLVYDGTAAFVKAASGPLGFYLGTRGFACLAASTGATQRAAAAPQDSRVRIMGGDRTSVQIFGLEHDSGPVMLLSGFRATTTSNFAITTSTMSKSGHVQPRRRSIRESMDDFVVNDDEISWNSDAELELQEATARAGMIHRDATSSTIPHELIYSKLVAGGVNEKEDPADHFEYWASHGITSSGVQRQTLDKLVVDDFQVDDLNLLVTAAQRLEDSATKPSPTSHEVNRLFTLDLPPLSGLGDTVEGAVRIETLYRWIVANWVGPLSNSIPGQVRLGVERTARRVVATVYLASRGVESRKMVEAKYGQMLDTDDGPAAKASTHASEGVFDRLRRYASITNETAPISTFASGLVEQWSATGDPAEYDYRQHAGASLGSGNVEGSMLSSAASQRLEKTLERRRRRAEDRQAFEESQRAKRARRGVAGEPDGFGEVRAWQSSQPGPPQSMGRSSPVDAPAAAESHGPVVKRDGAAGPVTATASQIEPGRFGGRPLEMRPRVRARRAGF